MSKFIKLLSDAFVNGVGRRPHEGVLRLEDGEANRLIEDGVGVDVSADFSAEQQAEMPVQKLTAFVPPAPDLTPAPHLSEVPLTAAESEIVHPTDVEAVAAAGAKPPRASAAEPSRKE